MSATANPSTTGTSTDDLSKEERLKRYLLDRAEDGEMYFKGKFISQDVDLAEGDRRPDAEAPRLGHGAHRRKVVVHGRDDLARRARLTAGSTTERRVHTRPRTHADNRTALNRTLSLALAIDGLPTSRRSATFLPAPDRSGRLARRGVYTRRPATTDDARTRGRGAVGGVRRSASGALRRSSGSTRSAGRTAAFGTSESRTFRSARCCGSWSRSSETPGTMST